MSINCSNLQAEEMTSYGVSIVVVGGLIVGRKDFGLNPLCNFPWVNHRWFGGRQSAHDETATLRMSNRISALGSLFL